MTLKPSQASVSSHSAIVSAISPGVPTICSPPYPPTSCANCRTVRPSRRASAISARCPLWL